MDSLLNELLEILHSIYILILPLQFRQKMIIRHKGKFKIKSLHNLNKNLGEFQTKKEAVKRVEEINFLQFNTTRRINKNGEPIHPAKRLKEK